MDAITIFAIIVFSISWLCYARTPREEVIVRLFFGIMLGMSAAAGFLGMALRYLNSLSA